MEWVAAVAGLVNVYLLTRQSIWSWPAGLLSVFIYAFIFYNSRLYSDVLLHIIYVLLNIYGWYRWVRKESTQSVPLSVSLLSFSQKLWFVVGILAGFMIWGMFLKSSTRADYVYADAFILAASLCAQYLLAVKKLENWILWIIVDIVAIILYAFKSLYVTSGLYAIYLILCIRGYWVWHHTMQNQHLKITS